MTQFKFYFVNLILIYFINKSEEDDSDEFRNSSLSNVLPIHGPHWIYDEDWDTHFKDCSGSNQSPIEIFTSDAVRNVGLNLKFINYDKPIRMAYLENNGHTVQLGIGDRIKIVVTGSAVFNRKYIFEQLHFHWGNKNSEGSEHILDGKPFPMEVHLVHYREKYGSFDKAVDKPDGLMVLGSFYQISQQNNNNLDYIINLVKKVPKYKDKAILMKTFTLKSLLPTKLKPFFRYKGSLTTPPCYQSVLWIIFKKPVSVGSKQEQVFRKCRGEEKNAKGLPKLLNNNNRKCQPINGREIFISSD